MPMHLQRGPMATQRPSITSVSSDFTRTPFPNIRFDPAPSPKKPAYAERRLQEPDPNPILCSPPANLVAAVTNISSTTTKS